ncbi:unnamed protein product [Dracunculus medinensis]|uniref:VPS9 domain-containing protein n=1 Tax=Dracunculus medinensis TaxID=318479 RepID=A0A0N4U4I4_DRAME|nr:unnamed protein product [Dracunculus medinensis]
MDFLFDVKSLSVLPYQQIEAIFVDSEQRLSNLCVTHFAAAGEKHIWTTDDLIPVFIYVIIRAQLQHLGAEIRLIDDFTPQIRGAGEMEMMFTTLKAKYPRPHNAIQRTCHVRTDTCSSDKRLQPIISIRYRRICIIGRDFPFHLYFNCLHRLIYIVFKNFILQRCNVFKSINGLHSIDSVEHYANEECYIK